MRNKKTFRNLEINGIINSEQFLISLKPSDESKTLLVSCTKPGCGWTCLDTHNWSF